MKASIYNMFVEDENHKGECIVFNTLMGSIVRVDEELKNILQNFSDEKIDDEEIVRNLKEAGMLVDDHVDEIRIFKVRHDYGKWCNTNAFFTVLTTYACNLACNYCYERYFFEAYDLSLSQSMDEKASNLTIEFMKNIANRYNYKKLHVILYGGEPMLNVTADLRIVDAMSRWTEENGFGFSSVMFTNGVLLTKDVIEDFSKYGVGFTVTLAGSKAMHDKKRPYKDGRGTFDEIVNAIGLLKDLGDPFRIRIDVDKENCMTIPDLLVELKDKFGEGLPIGIHAVIGGSLPCYGGGKVPEPLTGEELRVIPELWEKAFEMGFKETVPSLINWVHCAALTNHSYVIDPFCDVYKCWGLAGLKQHRIGTLDNEGKLSELEYTFYDWMSIDPLTIEECKKCLYLPACCGGCPGVVYDKFGTYHKAYCSSIEQVVKDFLKVWIKIKENPIPWEDEVKRDNLISIGF